MNTLVKLANIFREFYGPPYLIQGLTYGIIQDEYIGVTTPAAGIRVAIHEPGATSFPGEQGTEVLLYYGFQIIHFLGFDA